MKTKVQAAAATFTGGATHFPYCKQRTEVHAERQHAISAISQVAMFSGICAGAPGPDIVAYVRTPQDVHQFRTGYLIMAAVCAFLMLIEMAVLPGIGAVHHHTTAAATATSNAFRGR
jgi:hypothetical protein